MSLQLSSLEQNFFIERDPGKSVTLLLSVTLREEVDPVRLKEAAEAAAVFFPRMRQKAVLTGEGKFVLRPNDRPLPVFEDTGKLPVLGSGEANGYLYVLKYIGHEIRLSLSHSIADGGAAISYLRQLIYEYFRLSGENIPDEGLVYTKPAPEEHFLSMSEAVDLYERHHPSFAAGNSDRSGTPISMQPAVNIYPECPLFGTPYAYSAGIMWNNEELMRTVKELKTTPFSFLSAAIVQAVSRAADTDGKVIRESYGYSLRKLLNVPSQCTFTLPSGLCLEPGLSMPEMLQKIRSQMDANGDLEKLLRTGRFYEQYTDRIINGLDLRDIVPVTEKFRSLWAKPEVDTFYFANFGVIRFPSRIEEHLSSFDFLAAPQKKVTDFYSFVYQGRGMLRTVINTTEECLLRHISTVMQEYGISCTRHETGKFRPERTDVLRFEQGK